MVSIEIFAMTIWSDLKQVEQGTSLPHVTLPAPVTPADSKRKVTDEEVFQFFNGNHQASYIEAAEALQVARQTIIRKVSRLIEDGKIVKDDIGLIVVSAQAWSPEVA